ncbi:MAG: chemotaxis protein [Chromatiales bacterium 21-64-14]|nr:MAG: chemotaxis protein [Chromatiales bacterium 21-64-14]
MESGPSHDNRHATGFVSGIEDLNDTGLTETEYEDFRAFLEESCGIALGDQKQYLLTTRLRPLLEEFRYGSVGELLGHLRKGLGLGLRERVVDAMTTNETYWFRDGHPYEILANTILPELDKRPGVMPRLWSAACSSGQEPYSISIVIQEYLRARPGAFPSGVQVVGTDISPTMLKKARSGLYHESDLARGLPAEQRDRYFKRRGFGSEINPEIRARVRFMDLNLLKPYTLMGNFDVIFCRNVLIYFSAQSRRDILERMIRVLNPGGYMVMGASESLANHASSFQMVRVGGGIVYRLKDPSRPLR